MASTTSSSNAASPNYIKELPNAILGFFGLRTESELPYETRMKDGDFSVRHYPAHAEIRNEEVGTRKESANKSFGRLLAYIQGENWDDESFSMTTPVIQRPSGQSRWSTSFYMKEPIENLPLPKTSAVKLYAHEAEVMAVVRFAGNASEERVHEETTRLMTWMSRKGLRARGEPQIAQFDQPFAIPLLKRNEIHIPLSTD